MELVESTEPRWMGMDMVGSRPRQMEKEVDVVRVRMELVDRWTDNRHGWAPGPDLDRQMDGWTDGWADR